MAGKPPTEKEFRGRMRVPGTAALRGMFPFFTSLQKSNGSSLRIGCKTILFIAAR